MAKKKKDPTVKEQLKQVLSDNNAIFRGRWKAAWEIYKTVIGPFIKGTATYIWALIYGCLYWVGSVAYNCGKVLLVALLNWIKRI
jgi:hypothetical protein